MHPILFDFGFYKLHTYGLMLALAFLTALIYARHAAKRINVDPAHMSDLLIWTLLGGILGARLLYFIIHPEEFSNIAGFFAIWKGGLVYYGGFIGGVVGGLIYVRRKKLNTLDLSDLAMPAIMLGQAIGRIGCFMAGCCYGKPVDHDHPLGIAFPEKPDTLIPPPYQNADLANPTCFLHPSQLYMAVNGLVLGLLLWFLFTRRKKRGVVTGVFLVLYPITRSYIELFRGDNAERVFYGPLSTSQWVSVPVFLFGIYLLVSSRKRPVPDYSRSEKK